MNVTVCMHSGLCLTATTLPVHFPSLVKRQCQVTLSVDTVILCRCQGGCIINLVALCVAALADIIRMYSNTELPDLL